MARAALTLQNLSAGGLAPSFTAAIADGHAINNQYGNVVLWVKNGSGASINITIVTPGTVDGNAIADKVVAVPAGADRIIGPFDPRYYNQDDSSGDTGLNYAAFINYSATASVTIAALRIA